MDRTVFGPVIQHAFVVKDMDAALAYWIDVNDGLLHHMCVTVDSMDDFKSGLDASKFETLAELALEPEGHVLYLRGAGQRWPLIEVGDFPSVIFDLFEQVKAASIGWDGSDPIRAI